MDGGALTTPVWNKVDGSGADCGSCHGLPPGAPHPAVGSISGCVACHADTVNSDGSIHLATGRLLDGNIDVTVVGGISCTACHGNPSRSPSAIAPAPPVDTKGNTTTSAAGVGAHQRHLLGGSVRGPLACNECHVVPGDVTHAFLPLQLTWGALARTGGTTPTFDAATHTCANYCHGSTGSVPAPVWNKVDGTQAACGACHGLPRPCPIRP